MDHVYDVVVVGCGPVGAVLANLLGSRGIDTLVLECAQEPYDLPRAIHFDHEVMRILQSAGLADEISQLIYSPAGAIFFGAGGWPIRRYQPNERTNRLGWPSANYFYQPDLERVLRREAVARNSVTLRTGVEVQAIAQDEDGVTVGCVGDATPFDVRGRYVVACDGARSVVRRSIGVGLEDLLFDEPWIVVDAFVDGPITLPDLHGTPEGVDMQDVLFIIGDPERPTSVIPGIGRHRRWEFMLLPHETPELYATAAAAEALIAPFVVDASFELIRAAVYRFHALIATEWQRGRVFLAGDSAHQTPPFFGQGMCHGIRDVANLAWKFDAVLRGTADDGLLASYEVERKPQVRSVIEAAIKAGRYLCTLDPALAERRDVEMRAQALRPATGYLDLIPPLTAGILAASEDLANGRGATGSRFIQPPMTDLTGVERLMDDWTGTDFVLISRVPDPPPQVIADAAALGVDLRVVVPSGVTPTGRELVDVSGEMGAWFATHSCDAVMLRPDAYVFGTAIGNAAPATLMTALIATMRRNRRASV